MQSAAIRGNQEVIRRSSGGHQEGIRGHQTHLLELLALASLLSLLLLFEFGALLSLLLIVLPLTLRVGFLELSQPLRVDELLWGNVGRNQPPSVGNGRHQPPSGR